MKLKLMISLVIFGLMAGLQAAFAGCPLKPDKQLFVNQAKFTPQWASDAQNTVQLEPVNGAWAEVYQNSSDNRPKITGTSGVFNYRRVEGMQVRAVTHPDYLSNPSNYWVNIRYCIFKQ